MIRLFTIPLLFFFLMTSCTADKKLSIAEDKSVQEQIRLLLDDPVLASAEAGIYIENLEDGTVLFRKNSYKRLIPASNMKLYTTAAALTTLGSDFTYETEFLTDGVIVDSVLNGDLIIRGKGDPTISGRYRDGQVLAYFRDWADTLKNLGIKRIQGRLTGDESYFRGDKLGPGWMWSDEPYWYSAQINALSFNDNCIDLEIVPGDRIGAPVTVRREPDSDYVTIRNEAITTHPDSNETLKIFRERARNTIRISGKLPLGAKPETESVTIEDPGLYFVTHFKHVLDTSGIVVKNTCRLSAEGFDYDTLKPLFKHRSPTLREIVRVINKGSHNFYADQLYKTMGAEVHHTGTWKTGKNVVERWLSRIGVAVDEMSLFDGSGLSRVNRVTPVATAALLRYMYRHPEFEAFYESLPIAGVDGTISHRMKGTAAEGNVRAKTGYVMHARSLSGYAFDKNKTPYLFVMMVNDYAVPTPYINYLQDRICILLCNSN